MKKIALMLSIILSVFFLNVNATENNFSVEYAQFGYRLDVTGDIKKAVNLSVFKDIPAELADATENGELTIEKILLSGGQPVAIKQFEKIGYHTLSVPVSQELSDGVLYVFLDGEFEGTFKYTGKETLEKRAEIIAEINEIDIVSDDANDKIWQIIAENEAMLDLPEDTIESWDNEAASLFIDYLPIEGNGVAEQMDSFEKAYFISTALRYINKNDDHSLIESKLKQYSRVLGFDVNKYDSLTDAEKKTYTKVLNGISFKKKNLNDCFTEAEIVAKCVNSIHATELIKILSDNQETIGLNLDNYKMVDESVAEMLKNISGAKSYKDIISCFEDANDVVITANTEPSKNSGGGGGSSRGFSGDSINGVSINKYIPEIIAEDEPINGKISFDDMDDVEWANEAVQYLANLGIIEGRSERIFAPNSEITRGEFAKIIALVGNFDERYLEFSDVEISDWYCGYIGALYENKIMYGRAENEMQPESYITRQEAATMIKRFADAGMNLDETRSNFKDMDMVQEYAKDAVEILGGNGIITGYEDGTFCPDENITRAECAVIIYRLLSH